MMLNLAEDNDDDDDDDDDDLVFCKWKLLFSGNCFQAAHNKVACQIYM